MGEEEVGPDAPWPKDTDGLPLVSLYLVPKSRLDLDQIDLMHVCPAKK